MILADYPILCMNCQSVLLVTTGSLEERNSQALQWRKSHHYCSFCGRKLNKELTRFDY